MPDNDARTCADCYTCGYRRHIPGDSHSSCAFDFWGQGIKPPAGKPHGIRNGWWMHPWNFDPIWMQGNCNGFSMTAEPDKTTKLDPAVGSIARVLFR